MTKSIFLSFLCDSKPVEKGWYATLHCWDPQEGFFPGAAFWNGKSFDSGRPISNFVDKVFKNKEDAEKFAYDNDPNW